MTSRWRRRKRKTVSKAIECFFFSIVQRKTSLTPNKKQTHQNHTDSSFAASDEEEEDDDSGSSDDDDEEEKDFDEEEEEEAKKKPKKQAAPAAKAQATASTVTAPRRAPAAAAAAAKASAAAAASTAPPVLFRKAARVTVAASAAIAAEREKGADEEGGDGGGDDKEEAKGEESDLAADDDEPLPALSQQDAARRAANVAALLGGSLAVSRRPIAQSLSVAGAEAVLRSAFCSPVPGALAASETLRRKLAKRRAFVPWGSNQPLQLPAFRATAPPVVAESDAAAAAAASVDDGGPPPGEPLCLWEEPEKKEEGVEGGAALASSSSTSSPRARIMVDPMLTRWLRPHQREGVAFMFECVTGIKGFEGRGCLLADDVSFFFRFFPLLEEETKTHTSKTQKNISKKNFKKKKKQMGLGKTLQALTLLWTLLTSGHQLLGGSPLARRAVICCPTSLVGNWEAEARKFLRGRLRVLALCECSRDEAAQSLARFLSPQGEQVLVVSYETFRIHAPKFDRPGACDLLICDEVRRF